ncbi:hypothetical protein [Methylomonas sp. AM2-LC]|uniref:hypothetical protein n=1 Tax=Methylomonas sp. AM2-LC TaxID=3153301 RepID=UPI0032679D89
MTSKHQSAKWQQMQTTRVQKLKVFAFRLFVQMGFIMLGFSTISPIKGNAKWTSSQLMRTIYYPGIGRF